MLAQSTAVGRFLVFLAVGLVLAGCKASPSVEIYLSDLKAVAGGETKPVVAAARVSIEVLSKNGCERDQAKLVDFIKRYFSDVENFACADTKGPFGEMRFDTKLPIVTIAGKAASIPPGNVLFLGVVKGDGGIALYAAVAGPIMQKLAADARQQFFQDVGKGEFASFTVRLVNDLPDEQRIGADASYVNGKAFSQGWSVKLARRDKVEIGLSNVHIDALRQGDAALIANLLR